MCYSTFRGNMEKKIFQDLKKVSEDIDKTDLSYKYDLSLAIDTLAHVFEYYEGANFRGFGEKEVKLLKLVAKRLELVAEHYDF